MLSTLDTELTCLTVNLVYISSNETHDVGTIAVESGATLNLQSNPLAHSSAIPFYGINSLKLVQDSNQTYQPFEVVLADLETDGRLIFQERRGGDADTQTQNVSEVSYI